MYDDAIEKWQADKVRLEVYLEVNNLTNKKQRTMLVSVLTTWSIEMLCGRYAPRKINDL